MGGNNEFFENFERNKYLKKLPSMQIVKNDQIKLPDVYRCTDQIWQLYLYSYCIEISHCMSQTSFVYVTSSAKRDLIAEETVSSQISFFYTFAIAYFIKTSQGARKMFRLDVNQQQISQALIRRRASCAASDQGL